MVDRAFLGLYAIFMTLKKNTRKSKVLFTSNTCFSPVFASIYAKMNPIFSDISLENFLMDENETIEIIKNNREDLAAVVYIYTFGHTSKSLLHIKQLTQQYGITLIEDVAQAFGSKVDDQLTGTIGDLSVFSFGYSKHIDAGSGGFIINNNPLIYDSDEIVEALSIIKRYKVNDSLSREYKKSFYRIRSQAMKYSDQFFLYQEFVNKYESLYFKELKPDWLNIKFKLERFITNIHQKQRNDIAKRYYEGIVKRRLQAHIYAPVVRKEYSIYRYTILTNCLETSQGLSECLRKNDIHCSNLYIPVSRLFTNQNFNKSLDFSRRCINLWVDSIATRHYIEKTLECIENYYRKLV